MREMMCLVASVYPGVSLLVCAFTSRNSRSEQRMVVTSPRYLGLNKKIMFRVTL